MDSSPSFEPPVKEGIDSVEEMEFSHPISPAVGSDSGDFKQSAEDVICNGDLIVAATLIRTEASGDNVVDSDGACSGGLIMDIDVVSVDLEEAFSARHGSTDGRNDSNLEKEADEDNANANSVKVAEIEVVEEELLHLLDSSSSSISDSNGVFPPESKGITSDFDQETSVRSECSGVIQPDEPECKGIMEDYDLQTLGFSDSSGVLPSAEAESKRITEDCDQETSVCSDSNGVHPPAEPESKIIMENYHRQTSVFSNSVGVLPPCEPESEGIMEDCDQKTSVCSDSNGVLLPCEPESEGIMEDYDMQTSVCSDSSGVLPLSESESGEIMEDDDLEESARKNISNDITEFHTVYPFVASDLKKFAELRPDSPSMASDLEIFTELYHDPPSMASDLNNFSDLHHNPPLASDLEMFTELDPNTKSRSPDPKKITELHPGPLSMASDIENSTELHPHSPSMASDLSNFTELHPEPPSIPSDLENLSELHPDPPPSMIYNPKKSTELHHDIPYTNFTGLHHDPPAMASDLKTSRTDELKSIEQQPFQALNESENSKNQLRNSFAEVDEERIQEGLNHTEITQQAKEDGSKDSREEKSQFNGKMDEHELDGDEAGRIDDKHIQISQPTKYKPVFIVPPNSLKPTSWRSCCGLLDVLRSYK